MRNMLRLWALPGVLLALCLLLALPAAALEAEKTVRVTCDYPQELCSFAVRVPNKEQTWPLDSDIPYDEGKDYVWLAFEIEDIAQGWRIKSVRMNGDDRTESFVNGGYGGMATYIRADTAVQVELEEIPASLPSVTGVTLYTDKACTQAAPENVSYNSGSGAERLYGKGTYSDGGDYPGYYGTGQWEYSTDGVEWLPARTWGSNRWDFWPGWQGLDGNGHPELDFVNESYDIRLRVTPKDRYTSGGDVISNVVHVNGGAGGSAPGAQVTVSQVKAGGGKLSFTVSSTNVTWGGNKREGSLFLAGWRDGRLSDAAYTAKSSGEFSLSAETAAVFFLEEKTWIPLAEKLIVTAEQAAG